MPLLERLESLLNGIRPFISNLTEPGQQKDQAQEILGYTQVIKQEAISSELELNSIIQSLEYSLTTITCNLPTLKAALNKLKKYMEIFLIEKITNYLQVHLNLHASRMETELDSNAEVISSCVNFLKIFQAQVPSNLIAEMEQLDLNDPSAIKTFLSKIKETRSGLYNSSTIYNYLTLVKNIYMELDYFKRFIDFLKNEQVENEILINEKIAVQRSSEIFTNFIKFFSMGINLFDDEGKIDGAKSLLETACKVILINSALLLDTGRNDSSVEELFKTVYAHLYPNSRETKIQKLQKAAELRAQLPEISFHQILVDLMQTVAPGSINERDRGVINNFEKTLGVYGDPLSVDNVEIISQLVMIAARVEANIKCYEVFEQGLKGVILDLRVREKVVNKQVLEQKKIEDKTRRAAEEKARKDAKEKSKREAEEKVRKDAEEKAKREKEKARKEAEKHAKKEAEEKAKREAEEKAKRDAEEKSKKDAEKKAEKAAAKAAKKEEKRIQREKDLQEELSKAEEEKFKTEEKAVIDKLNSLPDDISVSSSSSLKRIKEALDEILDKIESLSSSASKNNLVQNGKLKKLIDHLYENREKGRGTIHFYFSCAEIYIKYYLLHALLLDGRDRSDEIRGDFQNCFQAFSYILPKLGEQKDNNAFLDRLIHLKQGLMAAVSLAQKNNEKLNLGDAFTKLLTSDETDADSDVDSAFASTSSRTASTTSANNSPAEEAEPAICSPRDPAKGNASQSEKNEQIERAHSTKGSVPTPVLPEDKSPPPVTNGTFVRPKRPCAFAPHIQSMAPASVRPLPNINSFQRPAAPLPVIHLPSPYPPQQQHIILQQKWNMWQSILLQINPSFSQFKMLVNMKMQNPMCAIESLNGINQVLTTIQRPVLFEIIDANFTAEVEHLAANLRDFINSEECSVSKGAKTAMNTGLTSALNTFLHLTQRPEPQLSFAPQVRPPFMPFYG